jgi:hypothetical protein
MQDAIFTLLTGTAVARPVHVRTANRKRLQSGAWPPGLAAWLHCDASSSPRHQASPAHLRDEVARRCGQVLRQPGLFLQDGRVGGGLAVGLKWRRPDQQFVCQHARRPYVRVQTSPGWKGRFKPL